MKAHSGTSIVSNFLVFFFFYYLLERPKIVPLASDGTTRTVTFGHMG
jgi:hypothetical protein